MNVNNKNFESFNAQVVSFDITSSEIDNHIELSDGSMSPIMGKQQIKPSIRELVLDFINEEDINRFISEVSSFSIIEIDDGYQYRCYLKETPSITKDGYQSYTVTCEFYVIKQKEMVIVDSKQFVNEGNIETECLLELQSDEELELVEVNNYTIHHLKANDPLIIDGINKTVFYLSEEKPAFDDVDMNKFPRVAIGENNIKVSDERVRVTLKYYPTFLC